ncbi:putative ATP-dependent RNA helicase CHL1 [Glarea lozoyensis 74030]|uniref:Putative ATP-dependent RNA helicase CHL1 n=1 Tax=Glarea lozoyensis (strain ATCC 74030 / MF5533) TaxID=1104152 RepID=H0EUN6_GLAL7|nr:putative ATP-dependent RNA helicase CHL1 [Glarea lozoyensis 74030]
MVVELARAVLNICTVVPDGIVVFFPSYAYLSSIVAIWSQLTSTPTLFDRLGAKKPIFSESKTESAEQVLAQYAHAIDTGKGGLLLSVIGGKMSEGINFSDRLGRCVVIVGLPFPNINSADWKAKLEYIESATTERLTAPLTSSSTLTPSSPTPLTPAQIQQQAKTASLSFYENACMRADSWEVAGLD